jgi:methylphosphotriester-DNA--protein-cysteine methyltransferase
MHNSTQQLLTEAKKQIREALARRRLARLAKQRGLSAVLLRKINKGKRTLTYKTASLIVRGYYSHEQMEKDMAIEMIVHYDPGGKPTLVKTL